MAIDARSDEPLLVGAAVEIITPDPLLPVSGGFGAPNPAKEKKGELTSRVVVFQLNPFFHHLPSRCLAFLDSLLRQKVQTFLHRQTYRQ